MRFVINTNPARFAGVFLVLTVLARSTITGSVGAASISRQPARPKIPPNSTLKNVSIASQKGVSVTDAESISFVNVRVENQTGELLKTYHAKNRRLDLTK